MNQKAVLWVMMVIATLGTSGFGDTQVPTTGGTNSNLVLSVSLSNTSFRATDRIEIAVTYSNHGAQTIEIDEGSLRGRFADADQEGMFMQAARASLSRGVLTITLTPGEHYTDVLTLMPKDNVNAGTFRLHVVSSVRRRSGRAIDAGEVVFRIE